MGAEELKKIIGMFRKKKAEKGGAGTPIHPESTFDAMLDLRLQELQREVGEVKSRVNGLFFFVLGAAILQVGLKILP